MQSQKENPQVAKKAGKKVAVVLTEGIDPEISLELLSVIYADMDIEPVSLEQKDPDEEAFLNFEDILEPMMLHVKDEIICPIIPLFDSQILVLNYQKFYET